MGDNTSQVRLPVEVCLDLTGNAAAVLARSSSEVRQRLGSDIERAFSSLLDVLGISSPVTAAVQIVDDLALTGGRFIRLRINGRVCRYSNDLLQSVYSYVTGRLLDPHSTPEVLQAWLGKEASEAACREFLAHASIEAAKQQAGILLTRARVSDYLACVPELTGEDVSALTQRFDVHAMFRELLDLGLSLADMQTIGTVLRRYQEKDLSASDIVEVLIETLRPDRIELRMPLALMHELTAKWDKAEPETFRLLRDGLFTELGVVYPTFAFVASDDLKPGTFTFTINHLTVPPCVALQPPRLLVSAPLKDMTGFDAEAAANPATRQAGTVVSSADREQLESRGLVVWDAMGYFLLCLADALRTRAECFIDRRTVQGNLEVLKGYVPALVNAVRLTLADEDIARVVRALAAEQMPLHHLPAILDALLQCDDPVPSDGAVEGTRVALHLLIAEKYSRGTSTLAVYLLDQAIEAALTRGVAHAGGDDASAPPAEGEEQILAAVRKELDYLLEQYPTVATPHLLTRPELRLPLRRLVAREFPRLSVLSLAEIPATTNIQPVARIAFP
jgi:flagellar biosynthesis component FlhA